jgi:hypothetical protein
MICLGKRRVEFQRFRAVGLQHNACSLCDDVT